MARFERLTPDTLLEHPLRSRLHQHLRTQPGATTADAARALRVHHKTAHHHLEALVAYGHAATTHDGRSTRYYPANRWTRPQREVHAHARAPTARHLVQVLATHPGLTAGELRERVPATPASLRWHLARLRERRILHPLDDGQDPRYALAPAYRDAVAALAGHPGGPAA